MVVAALWVGQAAAAERVAQFSFQVFVNGKQVSDGRIATRVDDQQHARITVGDDNGTSHTAQFLALAAGDALAVPVTFDGMVSPLQLKVGEHARVTGKAGATLVLTLDELTPSPREAGRGPG